VYVRIIYLFTKGFSFLIFARKPCVGKRVNLTYINFFIRLFLELFKDQARQYHCKRHPLETIWIKSTQQNKLVNNEEENQ
jgi:hypothetical protein